MITISKHTILESVKAGMDSLIDYGWRDILTAAEVGINDPQNIPLETVLERVGIAQAIKAAQFTSTPGATEAIAFFVLECIKRFLPDTSFHVIVQMPNAARPMTCPPKVGPPEKLV